MMSGLETEFKRQTPDEIIQDIIDRGYESFYCLLSGGKDSMAVTHYIASHYPEYFKGVVYTMTGVGLRESRHFVIEQAKLRKWNLWFTWAKKNYLPDWIRENGFGGQGVHNVVMSKLKFLSWRFFLRERRDENPIFISGVRKKESARRGQRISYKNPIDIDGDGKTVFGKPYFYKNGLELWDYINTNDLAISPVHDILNISGDCLCGCFADPKWELELIKQNYPYFYSCIKWGEKVIEREGTSRAKKHPTWGSGPSVDDIDMQKSISEFIGESNIEEYCTESCQVNA